MSDFNLQDPIINDDHIDCIINSCDKNIVWFVDFDSPCGLNDPSYLLYSTHAILLIIAGVMLLIAIR